MDSVGGFAVLYQPLQGYVYVDLILGGYGVAAHFTPSDGLQVAASFVRLTLVCGLQHKLYVQFVNEILNSESLR